MKNKKSALSTKAIAQDGSCKVVITKEIEDRHGEIVSVKGLDTSNYMQNPIVLWGHKSNGEIEDVVGKVIKLNKTVDAKGIAQIEADIEFADHPKAQYLENMVKQGVVSSVSIGFLIHEYDLDNSVITSSELYELSFVPVPANPAANVLEVVKSLDLTEKAESDIFKQLNLVAKWRPVVKEYRKSLVELGEFLGLEKTGDELQDITNLKTRIKDSLKTVAKSEEEPSPEVNQPEQSNTVTLTKKALQTLVGETVNLLKQESK